MEWVEFHRDASSLNIDPIANAWKNDFVSRVGVTSLTLLALFLDSSRSINFRIICLFLSRFLFVG